MRSNPALIGFTATTQRLDETASELAKLRAENTALRTLLEALDFYLEHKPTCARAHQKPDCDCGLAKLLEAMS